MSRKSNSRFDIEVLEPLLLMSASAIDAEPVEIACGGEDFSWTAQAPDSADGDSAFDGSSSRADSDDGWCGSDSGERNWGFHGGRDGHRGAIAWFKGNRADFSATDHGFGIFAIRCGTDNSTQFLTDVAEVEFLDGKCDIRELTAATEVAVEAEAAPEETVEVTALETSAAGDTLDDVGDAELFDAIVADDAITVFTEGDSEYDDIIVTSSVEELTEDVWFSDSSVEAEAVEVSGIDLTEDVPFDEIFAGEVFAESDDLPEAVNSDAEGVIEESDAVPEAAFAAVADGSATDGSQVVAEADESVYVAEAVFVEPELVIDPVPPVEPDDCPVMVEPVNQAPDGQDDAINTLQDTSISGTVATNDSDPDGDTLTFYIEQGPQNGSIEFATDGSYTYTPDPGFSGADSFTYEVSDGNGGTDIAEVCVNIEPVDDCEIVVDPANQAPDGQDDAINTSQDTSISGTVATNDSDPDGDTLTFYIEQGPQNGSIEFATDGSYTYTPDPGFSGADSFTYEVSDGNGGTDIATVNITVDVAPNQNPDAIKDVNSTDYNTAVEGTVLCNDVDPDSDSLSATLTTPPQNGTVTLSADGHYTYTPNSGFSGTDTFTYEVSDGQGGTDTAEVCIEVGNAPNNDVEAVDDDYSTDRDQSVDGNVLANDVDPDGDTLTTSPMTDVLTSAGGLVSLHEDGSFVYVPADGFTGVDTFTYSATDGNGSTASATVTIVVNDVPAPPQDDLYTGDSATEIQGDVTVNDGGDSGETEITIVDGPVNGTLTINSDGTFRYLANDGFSGDDSFTYSLSRCGVVAGVSTVRMIVAEVVYDTTYVSAGKNGRIWGDPHFEGDDGGLYDVQGEEGHIYNLLSDHGLQVNALYVPWEGHEGSTMMGQIGATVGTDLILADETGTFVNGVAVQAGEVIALADGQVDYDGEYTTVTTAEYKLRFHRREGWYDMKLDAINPFSDNVAPHGLWGFTVDGDSEARDGDFFKTHGWDYTLQGGGALDTVDANGNVVVSESGDRSAYKLYEAANLFSTDALNPEGDRFFRFSARQGTGLVRLS